MARAVPVSPHQRCRSHAEPGAPRRPSLCACLCHLLHNRTRAGSICIEPPTPSAGGRPTPTLRRTWRSSHRTSRCQTLPARNRRLQTGLLPTSIRQPGRFSEPARRAARRTTRIGRYFPGSQNGGIWALFLKMTAFAVGRALLQKRHAWFTSLWKYPGIGLRCILPRP